jgi:hypothetical protein
MLTDEELRAASPEVRAYWLRVFLLMNETNCSLTDAIAAVAAADEE